ncbi:MAG: T9SS type A sorting domain-containing protein [Ignavibacteriaceae bacterium]|nr:T9SS type A sorting domain-containing protein [Ignavibacteriaceae bacterium]
MKKRILLYSFLHFFLLTASASAQAPGTNSHGNSITDDGVVLLFSTFNNYGNNLYIDNVNIGKQYTNDIFVSSIDNINPDTSYSIGLVPYVTTPKVTVTNVGRAAITNAFTVTLTITPGGYTSTKSVPSVASGASHQITFDNLTITPGVSLNIHVQSNFGADENPANDQLDQYSVILPGVQRNVLFEEWTSSTCGPCASNNPSIDAFIQPRFDSIVAIKYHVGWPSPGNDPMYLYNTVQSYDRRFYYGVNSVPHLIMDGIVNPDYPYSSAPSLPTAFYSRKPTGSPISVAVTDQRIAGDSVKTTVDVTVHAPLMYGNYKLRVMVIERTISYASAPGTNGEKTFHDVFRKALPGSDGTALSTVPGSYSYTFTYKTDKTAWVDSMIYTAAFVQNDINKEVINCGKARHQTAKDLFAIGQLVNNTKDRSVADDIIEGKYSTLHSPLKGVTGGFNVEFFEGGLPAPGWRVVNPDGGLTFETAEGANGPSFGGNKSARVNFYSYSASGQRDHLYSKVFSGLESSDTVKFDYAYAVYTGYSDSLVVKLSTDGGATFPHEIFRKGGTGLATAPATTSSFVPSSPSQWRTFVYPLTTINVPVELTAFNASVVKNNVELTWTTSTETNNFGFEVEKSYDGSNFIKIGFVRGNGTSTEINNYHFTDKPDVEKNIEIYYRLHQVDLDGTAKYSNIISVAFELPNNFGLNQNYPNPFNPSTTISYSIAQTSPVTLKIYDVTGREIAVLVNEVKQPGRYDVSFDASTLSSGVYFYKLNAGSFSSVKKMSILK